MKELRSTKIKDLRFNQDREFCFTHFFNGRNVKVIIYPYGRSYKVWAKIVGNVMPSCDFPVSANQTYGSVLDVISEICS